MDIEADKQNENVTDVNDIDATLNQAPEHIQSAVEPRPTASSEMRQNANTKHPRKFQPTERRLRRFLRFHRYSPIKLKDGKAHFHLIYCIVILIQMVKIALTTAQMIRFAGDRAVFSSVVNRGHITLRHLLLKGWDAGMETPPYPPARGDFAVYEIDELLKSINYAVERYYNAENDAIGFYTLLSNNSDMTIRMKYFDFPGFDNTATGLEIIETNFSVDYGLYSIFDPVTNKTTYKYNITEAFEFKKLTDPVKRLLSIYLDFPLHSVRVYENSKSALCLSIQGTVSFIDEDNNGQMLVDLFTNTVRIQCSDINYSVPNVDLEPGYRSLGISVLVFCGISLTIGVLSFFFGIYLIVATYIFMKKHFAECYEVPNEVGKPTNLDWREYLKLVVVLIWDVLIILSDTFTIRGIIRITFGTWTSDDMLSVFDSNAMYISIGGLLSWLYILKVFKIQSKFHILFKTLYGAFSAMLAYLFCIGVLFIGFFLCGYVVLGPYHVKFETASATIETLFSISNGDEIFATLANVEYSKIGNNSFVWWFSRIYICTYVAVFTIVVLNILIAIFVEAYDGIKEEQQKKKDKRRFGPLEKALYDFLTNHKSDRSSSLRSSLYAVLDAASDTKEESDVKTELRKVWKMTRQDNMIKLERLREQTITAFIEADDDYFKLNKWRVVVYFW